MIEARKAKGIATPADMVIKTIVTTNLIDEIAAHNEVECYNTLTGFKYIAELIKEKEGRKNYIIGGEESYGLMIGSQIRDKDAVSAVALLCEMAAYEKDKGRGLYEKLIDLYVEYGIDADAEDQALEKIAINFTGITLMNQHYVGRGWEALFFISLTPIDFETTRQRMRLYLKDMGSQEAHDALGKPFVERFVYEVDQDLKVINFKKHLVKPKLCRGDGPIYQYREYAARFLPGGPSA